MHRGSTLLICLYLYPTIHLSGSLVPLASQAQMRRVTAVSTLNLTLVTGMYILHESRPGGRGNIMGTFEEPKVGPLDIGEEYSNITI